MQMLTSPEFVTSVKSQADHGLTFVQLVPDYNQLACNAPYGPKEWSAQHADCTSGWLMSPT